MDVEQEASALGWVPQEQFRGDVAKWVDAESFVSRGKEIMPILRKNNEKLVGTVDHLSTEVQALKSSLAEANEAMTEFRKFHDESSKREYDRAVKDLKAQRRTAREEGDHDLADQIEESLDELKGAAPKAMAAPAAVTAAPPPPALHPDYQAWESDNASWLKDAEKSAYAQSIAQYLRTTTDVKGRAFLDKVTEEVERRFAPSGSKVEGGRTQARSSGRTYADLPADARSACDRMATKLVGANKAFADVKAWRDSYAKSYDWE